MATRGTNERTYALSGLPAKIAAVLLVLILVNAVVLVWRWASERGLPPGTYHEYHIAEWQRASVERPDDPVVWSILGGLYQAAGDRQGAIAAYTRALELDQGNAAALVFLAQVDIEDQNYDRARERLHAAAAALPEGGAQLVYYQLGHIEEAVGNYDQALEYFHASVSQQPTYWNAHFRIAVLHERAGRHAEALEAAERAARFVPDNAELEAMILRLREARR